MHMYMRIAGVWICVYIVLFLPFDKYQNFDRFCSGIVL